jgi:hypothetical protein
MKRNRSEPAVGRSQEPTPFGEILGRLLGLAAGASAAVIVDPEGETVDYAGTLPEFDAKVAGAHLRIVLDEAASLTGKLGTIQNVLVRARRRSYLVRALPDGYALVIVLQRDAFAVSARAIEIAERELCREAGWRLPSPQKTSWYPVQIEPARRDRRRPSRMRTRATWEGIEVLGSVVGMGRDRGYRCRLRSGAELTLVREPAGAWYADERIDSIGDEAPLPKRGT